MPIEYKFERKGDRKIVCYTLELEKEGQAVTLSNRQNYIKGCNISFFQVSGSIIGYVSDTTMNPSPQNSQLTIFDSSLQSEPAAYNPGKKDLKPSKIQSNYFPSKLKYRNQYGDNLESLIIHRSIENSKIVQQDSKSLKVFIALEAFQPSCSGTLLIKSMYVHVDQLKTINDQKKTQQKNPLKSLKKTSKYLQQVKALHQHHPAAREHIEKQEHNLKSISMMHQLFEQLKMNETDLAQKVQEEKQQRANIMDINEENEQKIQDQTQQYVDLLMKRNKLHFTKILSDQFKFEEVKKRRKEAMENQRISDRTKVQTNLVKMHELLLRRQVAQKVQ